MCELEPPKQDKQWFYNAITYGKGPYAPVPVGGTVAVLGPVTLALLSPWLAVIGFAGCVGTALVATRKRRP